MPLSCACACVAEAAPLLVLVPPPLPVRSRRHRSNLGRSLSRCMLAHVLSEGNRTPQVLLCCACARVAEAVASLTPPRCPCLCRRCCPLQLACCPELVRAVPIVPLRRGPLPAAVHPGLRLGDFLVAQPCCRSDVGLAHCRAPRPLPRWLSCRAAVLPVRRGPRPSPRTEASPSVTFLSRSRAAGPTWASPIAARRGLWLGDFSCSRAAAT